MSGDIIVGDRAVYSSKRNIFLPPNERNFGMVFQSYAIWPHMNVFRERVLPAGSAQEQAVADGDRANRVMRVLGRVALDHLAEREATKLSGGQQQRLALARALVMEPKLLLLDEPLSNLDAKLREKMRFELKRMQDTFKLTTIYVTHDQSEALALSDEIAVMNEGRIVQMATPRDIYERPRTKFVADFIGTTNFLDGTVVGREGGEDYWNVRTSIGVLKVKSDHVLQENSAISISVRPEDVHLSGHARQPGRANCDHGHRRPGGVPRRIMDMKVKTRRVRDARARASRRSTPANGGPIHLRLDPEKCVAVATTDRIVNSTAENPTEETCLPHCLHSNA